MWPMLGIAGEWNLGGQGRVVGKRVPEEVEAVKCLEMRGLADHAFV